MTSICTPRLALVPASPALVRAAIAGRAALAEALSAEVPPTWPPEFLDEPALQFTLDRLTRHPDEAGWWMYLVVRREAGAPHALIGSGGYKGPPADGTVEVGYGIVSEQRRRGYATEVTRGLLSHAFALPGVRRVLAETLPELVGSIGVLEKCGFRLLGEGSEPGVIRFELLREDFG